MFCTVRRLWVPRSLPDCSSVCLRSTRPAASGAQGVAPGECLPGTTVLQVGGGETLWCVEWGDWKSSGMTGWYLGQPLETMKPEKACHSQDKLGTLKAGFRSLMRSAVYYGKSESTSGIRDLICYLVEICFVFGPCLTRGRRVNCHRHWKSLRARAGCRRFCQTLTAQVGCTVPRPCSAPCLWHVRSGPAREQGGPDRE